MYKTSTTSLKPKKASTKKTIRFTDDRNEVPGKHVIQNILNYSKALNIRPSALLNSIETVNN